MIAIHEHKNGFHKGWISYCEKTRIAYKLVDCYRSDIVEQLKDCSVLFWHHNHASSKDILFARELLFALEHAGIPVFPDFNTGWFFDDKVAQKYLLEAVGAPMVASYVFYSKDSALDWMRQQSFPLVFKLRGGAGSSNVWLVKSLSSGSKLVRNAFGRGFSNFSPMDNLSDAIRGYRKKRKTFTDVLKAMARIFIMPEYARAAGKERGYVYFQEFIPNNDFDIRIIVIGNRAFGLKRFVRNGDFRASGSGQFAHAREEFDLRCVQIAFDVNRKLKSSCIAYDFVFDVQGNPKIVEISYGYTPSGYADCPGYWNDDLTWQDGKVESEAWMIELVLQSKNIN